MVISPGGSAILALIMALWVVAAAWSIVTGMAMRRTARSTTRQLRRLTRLLDAAPALPLLVRADGRIEGPERLARWLGVSKLPVYLNELAGEDRGFAKADLDRLSDHVTAAQKTGKPFALSLAVQGSDTMLRIDGHQSDPLAVAAGGALLWVFDATDSERRMQWLLSETETARNAFSALSGLIEAAPVPMWFRAPDLGLMLVNSAYVRAVGAPDADHVIAEQIELVEPVEGVTSLAVAARAQESGEPVDRVVITTVAGSRRSLQVVDLPLGEQGIAGYAIDIQDLQDTRNAIDRFHLAQRDMLDSLSAGVAQFDADRSLIFCNQPFQRMFALKPQWVQIGQEFDRILDRMRETNRIPQVRDYPEWRSERGQWFHIAKAEQENWLLADGTHLRAIAQPTPDNGLLLIFEDRTEQIQLASARDTLLRTRTATFNNLYEALAVFASDGRLHLWNNRFSKVWSIDETALAEHPRVDELLKQLAPRLQRPAHISALREVIRGATLDRVQRSGQLVLQSGAIYNFVGIPLPDGNALFTMIDVTDSKQMERALRDRNAALLEADAVKTQFLANMSYEFRTPLTSIGGFAELLGSGMAGELSEQAQDYVKAIVASVERLSAQISNVLDLSQSEAGTLPMQLRSTDLAELLNEIGQGCQAQAAERRITLECNIASNLGVADVDRARLRQAIVAVLDNALRYTQEGGRVLLHADRHKSRPRIVVSDDGPGLDGKAQALALDGFMQERDARDGALQRRTGLGLPLARHLVEAHGGRLELVSEPGEGTIVTIAL